MSRSTCNTVLAATAIAALLVIVGWYAQGQLQAKSLAAIPEILVKSLLLWPALALVVGMLLEGIAEARAWKSQQQVSSVVVQQPGQAPSPARTDGATTARFGR